MRVARWISLAAALGLGAPRAQVLFAEAGKRHMPADYHSVIALAAVDTDRDGDLDIIVSSQLGLRLLRNEGQARFVDTGTASLAANGTGLWQLAAADLDRDGDPDLLVTSPGGPVQVLLNSGSGSFTNVTATHMGPGTDRQTALAVADFDGDGDQDFATGGLMAHSLSLFLNDGSGRFLDGSAGRIPPNVHIHVAHMRALDLDADGDQDLIATGDTTAIVLLHNNGNGSFTDITATHLPQTPPFWDYNSRLVTTDLDGDRDVDVLVAEGGRVRVLTNDGTGVLRESTSSWLPGVTTNGAVPAVADLDGDGDPDLIVAQSGPTRVFRNLGTTFVEASEPAFDRFQARSAALAIGDMDQDGFPDLIVGGWQSQVRLFLGGTGFVAASATPAGMAGRDGRAPALADVDGDGDLDVLTASYGSNRLLLINDGLGTFRDAGAQRMPPGAHAASTYAFLDLEGDGDLDALAAATPDSGTGMPAVLVNRNGTFVDETAVRMPPLPQITRTFALATADVDGDNDSDVIVSASDGTAFVHLLLVNDGQGRFAVHGQPLPQMPQPWSSNPCTPLALDANRDGAVDLLFAYKFQTPRLLLNDGTGQFTDVTGNHIFTGPGRTDRIRVVDLDNDGDLDVLGFGTPNRLLRNDGTGVFTDVAALVLPPVTGTVIDGAVGDVDGDGFLDIVFALTAIQTPTGNPLAVARGLPGGRFVDQTAAWVAPQIGSLGAIEMADLDGDGDLDLIGTAWSTNQGVDFSIHAVYENRLHRLSSPYLARVGRPWRLELQSGDPATAGPPALATLFLGRRLLPQPMPIPNLGVLQIDPARVLLLGTVVLPGPGVMAPFEVTLPLDLSLVGAQLFTQAVLGTQGLSVPRLSGAVQDLVTQ